MQHFLCQANETNRNFDQIYYDDFDTFINQELDNYLYAFLGYQLIDINQYKSYLTDIDHYRDQDLNKYIKCLLSCSFQKRSRNLNFVEKQQLVKIDSRTFIKAVKMIKKQLNSLIKDNVKNIDIELPKVQKLKLLITNLQTQIHHQHLFDIVNQILNKA